MPSWWLISSDIRRDDDSPCWPLSVMQGLGKKKFNYFSLVFLSRHCRRLPTPAISPAQLLITCFKGQPFGVILRPSNVGAHQKHNNLNIPKNRKNTYQHILIKNLESPSPVCVYWNVQPERERKKTRKKPCTCSYAIENKLHPIYPSYHGPALPLPFASRQDIRRAVLRPTQ